MPMQHAAKLASGGSAIPAPRQVIKTARIVLTHKHFAQQTEHATKIAERLGGFVGATRTDDRAANATLRIPVAHFDEAIEALKHLGDLSAVRISGTDVTAQVVDLALRLENLENGRKRYLELLAKAANVTEALIVQKELTTITGEIESLKGRLKVMRNQVALSTISLRIEKPVTPGPIGWIFYGLFKGIGWLFVWN